jgi:hypothetical protein
MFACHGCIGSPTQPPTPVFQDTVLSLATALEAIEEVTIQDIWLPAASKALWASLDDLLGHLASGSPQGSDEPLPHKRKKPKPTPGISIRSRVEAWRAVEDSEEGLGAVVAQALEIVKEGERGREAWKEGARESGVHSLQRVAALCKLLSNFATPLLGDAAGMPTLPVIASQACLLILLPRDTATPLPSQSPDDDSPQRVACGVIDALAASQGLLEGLLGADGARCGNGRTAAPDDIVTWGACVCVEAGRAVHNADKEGVLLPSLSQGVCQIFDAFGSVAYAASCSELARMHSGEGEVHRC